MPDLRIHAILGSTRQGRVGDRVARWFLDTTAGHTGVTVELIDLRDWPLPFLDTPVPPMTGSYPDPRTRRWADKIAEADGYVLVTPEYNHGYPGVLKNALDHVFTEWGHKPVGFVGYGGPAGGVRAVEQLRQVVIELQMVPTRHQVSIHHAYAAFDADGRLREDLTQEATKLIDEVARSARRLRDARR